MRTAVSDILRLCAGGSRVLQETASIAKARTKTFLRTSSIVNRDIPRPRYTASTPIPSQTADGPRNIQDGQEDVYSSPKSEMLTNSPAGHIPEHPAPPAFGNQTTIPPSVNSDVYTNKEPGN